MPPAHAVGRRVKHQPAHDELGLLARSCGIAKSVYSCPGYSRNGRWKRDRSVRAPKKTSENRRLRARMSLFICYKIPTMRTSRFNAPVYRLAFGLRCRRRRRMRASASSRAAAPAVMARTRRAANPGPDIVAEIAARSETELAAFIREGRPRRGMPAFALTDQEMKELVPFLRSLAPMSRTAPARHGYAARSRPPTARRSKARS